MLVVFLVCVGIVSRVIVLNLRIVVVGLRVLCSVILNFFK